MSNRFCLIYNFAQHYRLGVFKKLDPYFDFYFGDNIEGNIRKIEYSELKNFKKELINVRFLKWPIYYQKGSINLVFKPYTTFLMLGEYYCLSTWVILIVSRILNKRVFLWSHGWYGNESFIKKVVKTLFFKLGSGVLLYGEYARNLMLAEGFDYKKLHVIYNSLNYEEQIKTRNSLKRTSVFENHFGNNTLNLIFIGRLTKVKRLDILLQALFKIQILGKYFNLTIIGEGNERDYLEQLSKDLRVKTWFYGASYDESIIGELIYNADLCVSPGNVGLTAMHSLGFGTPVITHSNYKQQMPEFEAIIDGISGAFFTYNEVDSLAEAILKWFEIWESERDLVRSNCYKVIDEKYNPDFQAKVIFQVMHFDNE